MTYLSNINFNMSDAFSLNTGLSEAKQIAEEALKTAEVPTRKTEAWKYSAKYLKLPETYGANRASEAYQPIYELDCLEVVINSDGNMQFPQDNCDQIELCLFSQLDEEHCQGIRERDKNRDKQLIFSQLNTAQYLDGAYIKIKKGALIEKPLKIVFNCSEVGLSAPRVFIELETGASITIIEEISQTQVQEEALISSVCDIQLGANAQLNYIRMNNTAGNAKHIGLTQIDLLRDARLSSFCMSLGSAMGRHDFRVKLLEPGAECELNGVCVTKGKEHYDNHTSIEHIAPNCTSNENYRCIADDQSHIVFNGRIHIHPDAQKTLGEMSNKNLLLSSGAEIDSKPELEIYADDVRCAHGTTIGQLDETELYYLQTRGVSEAQARLMLTLGFVLEIVRSVPVESIAEYWEESLASLLSYVD